MSKDADRAISRETHESGDHAPRERLATHEVVNQPCIGGDFNAFSDDMPLRHLAAREAPEWIVQHLTTLGQQVGSSDVQALGETANRHPPELHLFDRYGRRLDEVYYHPAYHALMRLAIGHGIHSIAWREEGRGGHQAHIAGLYLMTQAEAGVCCPVTMTHAALPVLRQDTRLPALWTQGLMSTDYDPRPLPATAKKGLTFGMAMTEKQGGSDVRANTTRAEACEDGWRLVGHKWFCSAPMSDAFLTLAQHDEGLSCFMVPRFSPDGERNPMEIQRLKDKCGNRSNASAEIEYLYAWAQPIGEPGRGIATILEMVQQTRLDAATAPIGMMRQAWREVWHHLNQRKAFGTTLTRQPLMRILLADMAVEIEAGLALCLRTARAFDRASQGDRHEAALARLLPSLAKYWHNKRGPGFMAEAMECLGGIGYVEEAPLARLYREAPVNSIWEGSGNVICLDVLRVLARHPESIDALRQEFAPIHHQSSVLDRALGALECELPAPVEDLLPRARWITQRLAQCFQARLLLEHSPSCIAEAYCRSRLGNEASPAYGVLPRGTSVDEILQRAIPAA
ncbi:acyl-CoA dehydrogenase family protein [Halomonas binhaiensis]|uniref:Acyl-CoA dehydrogenase family protein n=1 Tax=Halomonas binhaiensis TaxID=2562282 RepID=A0A5C1NKR1_9GAMM|nr:acyl-CoA dehydrogenase family protein [Halomonas binhaiensis]QEM83173.1 acyl-CoA dehydrogenase family protein [Halomonas binhaiensis]